MVTHSRAAARPAGLLPLNLPQPIGVEANAVGDPDAVLVRGRLRPVVAIHDQWRIDDEWWRTEISRRYFALELESGIRVTVFCDAINGGWYSQQYTPPVRLAG